MSLSKTIIVTINTNESRIMTKLEEISDLTNPSMGGLDQYTVDVGIFATYSDIIRLASIKGLITNTNKNSTSRHLAKMFEKYGMKSVLHVNVRENCAAYKDGIPVGYLVRATNHKKKVMYFHVSAYKAIKYTGLEQLVYPFESRSSKLKFLFSNNVENEMPFSFDDLSIGEDVKSFSKNVFKKRLTGKRKNWRTESLVEHIVVKPIGSVLGFCINSAITSFQATALEIKEEAASKIEFDSYASIERMVSRFEDLALFLVSLVGQTSIAGFIASCISYYKTMGLKSSLFRYFITQMFKLISQDVWQEESITENITASLGVLKSGLANWQTIRSSELVNKAVGIIMALFSLEFLPTEWHNPEEGTLQLFCLDKLTLDVSKICKDSLTLYEVLVDGFIYFVEKGISVVTHGTVSSLIYEDEQIVNMNRRYDVIIASKAMAFADDIENFRHDGVVVFDCYQRWVEEIQTLAGLFFKLMKAEKDNSKKNRHILEIVSAKHRVLLSIQTDFLEYRHSKSVQEKPFGILIGGGSSLGKSTICKLLINAVGSACKFECGPNSICTLNGSDKYQSDFKPHHTVVVMDDHCNGSIETYKDESPLVVIIKFFNNVASSALQADADKKGKMAFTGKLGIVTTNVPYLHAATFSAEPVSVLRRFEIHLDVKVRPEFQNKEGMLDSTKMLPTGVTDAWLIDVYVIAKTPTNPASEKNSKDGFVRKYIGRGLSIFEVIDIAIQRSTGHFANEKRVLANLEMQCGICGVHHIPKSKDLNTGNVFCQLCPPPVEGPITKDGKMPISTDEMSVFSSDCDESDDEVSVAKESVLLSREEFLAKLDRTTKAQRQQKWLDLSPETSFWDKVSEFKSSRFNTEYQYDALISEAIESVNEEDIVISERVDGFLRKAFDISADVIEIETAVETARRVTIMEAAVRMVDKVPSDILEPLLQHVDSDLPTEDKYVLVESYWKRFTNYCSANLVEAWEKRNSIILNTFIGSTALVSLWMMFKFYRSLTSNKQLNEEAMVVPTPVIDPNRAKVNVLSTKRIDLSAYSTVSKTTDYYTLVALIRDSLGSIVVTVGDVAARFNALPLEGDYWLMPWHSLKDYSKDDLIEYELIFGDGNKTEGFITEFMKVGDQMTDLVVVRLRETGSCPNLLKFIAIASPLNCNNSQLIHVDHRNIDVSIVQDINPRSKLAPMNLTKQNYVGYTYNTMTAQTSKGWCGSVLLNSDRAIIAMHLSGKPKETLSESLCGAQALVKQDIVAVIAMLKLETQTCIAPTLPEHMSFYGDTITLTDSIPSNHTIHRTSGKQGSVKILGAHNLGRSKYRTSVKQFGFDTYVERHLGIGTNYVIPTKENLDKDGVKLSGEFDRDYMLISNTSGNLIGTYLQRAVEDYKMDLDNILMNCDRKLVEELCPYDLRVVVNGVDGIPAVNGLDMHTSGGLFKPGAKIKYATLSEATDFSSINYEFEPCIMEECTRLELNFRAGIRSLTPFKVLFKDEVYKIGKGKLRLMSASDLAFTILVKKYFQALVRLLYHHWLESEVCSGINPFSLEWSQLKDKVTKHGNTIIAGDFSNYDKRMSSQVILQAFDVLIYIARQGNYSEQDIMVMSTMAYEIAYPVYDYDGVFVMCNGSNPSGNPLTVIVNSIVNSIYMRYAFKIIYPYYRFSEHVPLVTYGDDGLNGVRDTVLGYTYASISEILAISDIKWTDSYKSSDLSHRTFDTIEDIDFLKRGFRMEDDHVLCPLALNSFGKSLYFHHCSKQKREIDLIFLQNLDGFLREMVQYGKKSFYIYKAKLKELLIDMKEDNCIPFLDEHRFDDYEWETLKREMDKTFVRHGHMPLILDINASDVIAYDLEPEVVRNYIYHDRNTVSLSAIYYREVECDYKQIKMNTRATISTVVPKDCVDTNNTQHNSYGPTEWSTRVTSELSYGLEPEMDRRITTFADENEKIVDISTKMDATVRLADDRLTLDAFMARPIAINQFTWESTSTVLSQFDPWVLYLGTSAVQRKLSNFRFLRGTLCVKFVVNGSKFHSGRLHISYEIANKTKRGMIYPTVGNQTAAQVYMHRSQMPGLYLDPNTNTGGTIKLPYVNTVDYLNIGTGSITMGDMYIYPLVPLGTVQASSVPVTITVYAWMEDLEAGTPTGFSYGLAPESDEYTEGIISKPATAVAALARKYSNMPIIGEYARATELAAGATANIAKMMGFSKPIDIESPILSLPRTGGNMANFNTKDTSQKLALDSKQEVTIDYMVTGAPRTDDLDIQTMCAKECMVSQFIWSPSNTPGDILYQMAVTPVNFTTQIVDAQSPFTVMSPSAMVAMMFNYWKCNMCYRFDLTCSSFHSGRLRIVYEPTSYSDSTTLTNTNYTWIIDLREVQEQCIEIGWNSISKFLRTSVDSEIFPVFGSPALDAPAINSDIYNGYITVSVETQLILPDVTSSLPVTINVFAKAKDATFGMPTERFMRRYSVMPFITPLDPESEITRSDGPIEVIEEPKGIMVNSFDESTLVFFGEAITSLRQLLKRYNYSHKIVLFGIDDEIRFVTETQSPFPVTPGSYIKDGVTLTGEFDERCLTVFDLLRSCYVGYRGSTRWKIFPRRPISIESRAPVHVTLIESDTYGNLNSVESSESEYAANVGYGHSGKLVHNVFPDGKPVEFEIPYYSRSRFVPGRKLTMWQNVAETYPLVNEGLPRWRFSQLLESNATLRYDAYFSVGEDASFHTFVATPVLYGR